MTPHQPKARPFLTVISMALFVGSLQAWAKDDPNRTLQGSVKFGSNFSYGPASSFDLMFKGEANISRDPHRVENLAELYSYYWGGPNSPVQRLKDKRRVGVKYLYRVFERWSPFFGYEFLQETSLKGSSDFFKRSQNADLGLRYQHQLTSSVYLQLESGYRQAYQSTTTTPNQGIPKLRNFLSIYSYFAGLNWGLWASHLAPWDDLGNYVIDFGPDLNYNLPGTSFYLGLTASATFVPQPLYDGDTRFKIWSGSFYGGFKL